MNGNREIGLPKCLLKMQFTLLLLILGTFSIKLHAQGIIFSNDLTWMQLKEKAKKENKYIFVDAFATWCGPCKMMDKEVYLSERVGQIINENFISVKLQMDSTKEDNSRVKDWYQIAREFKLNFKINSLPTFIFFDQNGNALHKFSGAVPDTTFIRIAQDAMIPERQFYTGIKSFNEGKLAYNRMPELIELSKHLGEPSTAAVIEDAYINKYLLKLPENQLMASGNLTFLTKNIAQTKSEGFKFIMQHSKNINEVLGPDKAEYAIRNAIENEFLSFRTGEIITDRDWEGLERNLADRFDSLGLEAVYGKRMIYSLEKGDSINFGRYYIKYFKMALRRPEYNINNLSWELVRTVNERSCLEYACNTVMKYAMDEWYITHPPANDTYANLFYKIGYREQAIKWEKNAIKLAKWQGAKDWEEKFTIRLARMTKGLPLNY